MIQNFPGFWDYLEAGECNLHIIACLLLLFFYYVLVVTLCNFLLLSEDWFILFYFCARTPIGFYISECLTKSLLCIDAI